MSGWFWVSLFLYVAGNLWTRTVIQVEKYKWEDEEEFFRAKLVMSTIWPVLPFVIGPPVKKE